MINCEKGFFTVVGSRVFKSQSIYRAHITSQGYEQEKTLQISLKTKYWETDNSAEESNEDVKNHFEKSVNVTLLGDDVQYVDFEVSKGDF